MQYDLFEEFEERRRFAREGATMVPPAEDLAPIVRFTREVRGWKQQTLAEFAGVSLSTVERIERGVSVSPQNLDRVAVALGYPTGSFTDARVPASDEEMLAQLEEWKRLFSENKDVLVRPLRKQSQVRSLLKADAYSVDLSRLGEGLSEVEVGLQEALDCYSFIIGPEVKLAEPVRRREVYLSVLKLVRDIEKANRATALAGTYEARTPAGLWTIALVVFFPRDTDPGVEKRRALLAPKDLDIPVPDWMRAPSSSRPH